MLLLHRSYDDRSFALAQSSDTRTVRDCTVGGGPSFCRLYTLERTHSCLWNELLIEGRHAAVVPFLLRVCAILSRGKG
jgi:hypothetical protein